MNYQECVEWLESVSLYGKKDGLRNMYQLMEELGNPEEGLPVVHVAGTNGKGTTCALLDSMLRKSGKRVGLFTSPHLIRYTERIRIDGAEIETERFAEIGARVRAAAEKMEREGKAHPTFFQLVTAIALVYFAEEKIEVAVLEVGVGGRLDATNIVKAPLCSVIASISLDHTKTLGSTIAEIAGEKAGIMKAGCPVILAHNRPEAMEVFLRHAEELKCPVYLADDLAAEILQNDEKGIRLAIDGLEIHTSLCGDYQVENLKTALCAAKTLGIPEEAIRRGVEEARWRGRMQWIEEEGRADLLLEGAHNEEGAQALGQWCRHHLRGRDVTLLFSAMRKKDISSMLEGLLRDAPFRRIIFAPMRDEAGLVPEEFGEAISPFKERFVIETERNVPAGLSRAREETKPEGLILCAGSLYLVGEVLECLEREGKHV